MRMITGVALAAAIAASGACSDRTSRTDRRAPAASPALPPPPRTPGLAEAQPPMAERDPEVSITGVMPVLGPAGQWVYVFGAGFVPGQTFVEVGGASRVPASVYDPSQLGFTVPADAHGTGPVTVSIPGARASSTILYTVGIPTGAPRIDRLEPSEGPGGTWVRATGENFVTGQTTIIVDGRETPGNPYGPDSLWFTVPADVARSGPVTIRTPNGEATTATPFRVTRR